MRDLGKLIVAKGFKKLPKFQKSPNLVTLPATLPRYLSCHNIQSDFVSFTTFLASRSVYLLFISLYTLSIHLYPSLSISLSLSLFVFPSKFKNIRQFKRLFDVFLSFIFAPEATADFSKCLDASKSALSVRPSVRP